MNEYQQYAALCEACQNSWYEQQQVAVLPLLAIAYWQLGEQQLAAQTYQLLLQHQASLDFDALVDVSALLLLRGDIDNAQKLLIDLLADNADHALAQARLGFCYFSGGDLGDAQCCYERSLLLAPQRITVHHHLIHIYLQQQKNDHAQRAVEHAFKVLATLETSLPEGNFHQYQTQLYDVQLQCWVANKQFSYADNWLTELLQTEQAGGMTENDFLHWVMQYARLLAAQDHHAQAQELLTHHLTLFPNNSALCLLLADFAQLQGQFMRAVQLLRNALTLDKHNIALWVQLSSACLHRFDKQARQAAERALALSEALQESDTLSLTQIRMQRAQAKNALALVACQEQQYALSEQLFREILSEAPDFLPALQGFGQQQMQRGNLDQALQLFERVKLLDPITGSASLINARCFPEDENILLAMEKAAQRPSLEGPVRASLLFQLASAWQKREQYERALQFAHQANAASKKFLPYDAKAHRQACARIRYAFSKSLFEHRVGYGVSSTLPVYVLGMPRSGTTLVEQILSGHSDIFGAGELGIIPQIQQGIARWERHVGSHRDYPDCIDDLSADATQGIAQKVLTELQQYAPHAKHVIDKLPHNFENIGLIKFLFPNAKIISVRRDPRDIALSNYFTDYQAKHGGMGFAYDLQDIGEQLADHNLLMHHWQQIFPGEILEIHYEQLLDDLEGSARNMLSYIGVDWQPEVLKFNQLQRPVNTASVWQVRQPIYHSAKGRWKHYRQHLAPLIKGTNARIESAPINDMLTLPTAGFLTRGVALYQQGDLDGAELSFKKMLHHNPKHAACHYMLGLIYLTKHHLSEGIVAIESALASAPWHKEWRDNLIKAYRQAGREEQALALQTVTNNRVHREGRDVDLLAGG